MNRWRRLRSRRCHTSNVVATSLWGLKQLPIVYASLNYWCMSPWATSVCGVHLLVYEWVLKLLVYEPGQWQQRGRPCLQETTPRPRLYSLFTYAAVRWRTLTYADVCMCDVTVVKRQHRGALYSRKLTYADVCTCHKRIHCRRLTYVGWWGVGWGGRYSRGTGGVVSPKEGARWPPSDRLRHRTFEDRVWRVPVLLFSNYFMRWFHYSRIKKG